MNHNFTIFGLSAGKKLTSKLCERLGVEPGKIETIHFADGEIMSKPLQYVRGRDVIIIQPTGKPVNQNYMELLITMDAMKRASARTINVIIPYMGYSRQDRKCHPREPISFRLIADMLQNAGANRVLTWDIHSMQTQGFFQIPFDSIEAIWILLDRFMEKTNTKDFVVVAPDYGAVKRIRDISLQLELPLAIIDKRRPAPNTVEICNILGDVKNRDCVLIDDMIDTGGTIINGAKFLKDSGAKSVSVLATHALFNRDAVENLTRAHDDGVIDHIFVTDTIEQDLDPQKFNVVSVVEQLEDIIRVYASGGGSLSVTIEKPKQKIIQRIKCLTGKSEHCETDY